MRAVRFSGRAQRQLNEISSYLLKSTGDRRAGARLVLAIEARMLRLATSSSTLGRPRPELGAGLRSLPHGAYLIFFTYGDENIDVLHVLHARRDLEEYFR